MTLQFDIWILEFVIEAISDIYASQYLAKIGFSLDALKYSAEVVNDDISSTACSNKRQISTISGACSNMLLKMYSQLNIRRSSMHCNPCEAHCAVCSAKASIFGNISRLSKTSNLCSEKSVIVDISNTITDPQSTKLLLLSITRYERILFETYKVKSLNITASLATAECWEKVHWQCKIHFNPCSPLSTEYRVEFLPPVISKSSNMYTIELGSFRFLNTILLGFPSFREPNWNQYWAPMTLFDQGIDFASKKYYFLGGEIQKTDRDLRYNNSVHSWFASEFSEISEPTKSDVEPSVNLHRSRMNIKDIRNYFGDLDSLLPSKCNARIKLGFSSIYPMEIKRKYIVELRDDVTCSRYMTTSVCHKSIMTDGCGYISSTLVKKLPYGISSGTYNQSIKYRACVSNDQDTMTNRDDLLSNFERPLTMPTPAIIQIRAAIYSLDLDPNIQGLYKGCLVVTDDEELCPSDGIVFRKSMKKSNKTYFGCNKTLIGVTNTFENPGIINDQKSHSLFKARINREICILFNCLGVNENWFLRRMEVEINNLKYALTNRKYAEKIVNEMHIDNFEDRREQKNSDSFFTPYEDALELISRDSLVVEIKEYLLSDQSINEPYIEHRLKTLISVKEKKLKKCVLPVDYAIYLVGAPDPYGILEPDQVFIGFPDDRLRVDMSSYLSLGYEGRVVVCKHPVNHPGDIRIFTSVKHRKLSALNEKTNSGIIYFSIKGERSPADMMSGSDYDGDQFLIFYGQDDIVSQIVEATPYDDIKVDAKPTSSFTRGVGQCRHNSCLQRQCKDPISTDIYLGIINAAQLMYISRYSVAWRVWASRDPWSPETMDCVQLIRRSLDAAKTGDVIPERTDLLCVTSQCFNSNLTLNEFADPAFSGGILHKLNRKLVQYSCASPELTLDMDMLFVLEAKDNCSYLRGVVNMTDVERIYNWYLIFPDWISELDFWISKARKYQMEVRNIMNEQNKSVARISLSFKSIILRDTKLFNSKIKEIIAERSLTGHEVQTRCRLASIVYIACYTCAFQSRSTSSSSQIPYYLLEYCWNICGPELNTNKRSYVRWKSNRSPLKMVGNTRL